MAIQNRNNVIFFIGFILSIVLLRYWGLNQSIGIVYNLTISFAVTYLVYLISKNLKFLTNFKKILSLQPEDPFVNRVVEYAHLSFILFFVGVFISSPENFLSMILGFVYFILNIILFFKITQDLYDRLRKSRMKKRLNGFKIVVLLALARLLIEILQQSGRLNSVLSDTLEFFDWILILIIIISSLFFASINNWIHYLARRDKRYLLWSLFTINTFIFIYLVEFAIQDGDTYTFYNNIMLGSPTLISSILFLILGITVRFSTTVIFSFSSSEVVEKKQTELSTLTYVNRIISKSKNMNEVVNVINDLTKNYMLGSISSIKIYAYHLDENFESVIGCSEDNYQNFKSDINYKKVFDNQITPIMISSLYEDQEYYFIKNYFKSASAFIYVPILENERLIGSIFVINDIEYPYEGGELEILQTFGDNLKIGVENSKLEIEIRERERLESEFKIAKKMQESLLPEKLTNTEYYELDGFSIPAEEVGGDFFDELTLKSGNRCLIQGDVSGKGIGASFFMAQIKGIAMAMAKESESGYELLCKINSTLFGNISKNLFVTMALLEFDKSSDNIDYLRAGHTPLAKFEDGVFELVKPKGIGIGIVNSNMFDKNLETVKLKGQILLCFTDGINELRNKSEQDFGFNRINEIIKNRKFISAEELNKHIKKELYYFAGEKKQHDDMTLVSLLNIDR